MTKPILLCCDLDRTLLPNGAQPESPQARPLLRALAARPEICLTYVSGRHLALLQQAIHDYAIPVPDYAVGDVGTTIYRVTGDQWQAWDEWHQEIAPDWHGYRRQQIHELLVTIDGLRLQETAKQNTFKLSYYAPLAWYSEVHIEAIQQRLKQHHIDAAVIWSIDEPAATGLLDVLPASATKLHAIRFLMQQKAFDELHTVFAGDSGNDLPVLGSGLQAILVANASQEIGEIAQQQLAQLGKPERLYHAQGGFLGMNGNYAAGVLEGVVHFIPEALDWLRLAQLDIEPNR